MKEYEIVISYLNNEIIKEYENLVSLNSEIKDLKDILNNIINNNFLDINKELFSKLYSNNYDYLKFIEIINILSRVDYEKLKKEPQIIDMLNLVNNIKARTMFLINNKEKDYQKNYAIYQNKKDILTRYIKFINGDILYINDDVIKKDVINYLENSKLDRSVLEKVINWLSTRKVILDKPKEEITFISDLPVLNQNEIELIMELESEFNELTDTEKNGIISSYSMIIDGEYDNLEDVAYGFNKNEILYYSTIYTLINLYKSYNELYQKENLTNASIDHDLYDVLSLSLKEIIDSIRNNIKKIQELSKYIENVDEIINGDVDKNIVLFLDIEKRDVKGISSISPCLDSDILDIKEEFGNDENAIKQVINMINIRFKCMPKNEFRVMGHNYNKPLFNHSNYKEFDEFNVRCSKGGHNNPARVTYITIPVSEKNKERISGLYNISIDFNIYLILGVFAKENDDSKYVNITHNRLIKYHDKVKELQKVFMENFNDITFFKAKKLIDDSYNVLEEISKIYIKTNVK